MTKIKSGHKNISKFSFDIRICLGKHYIVLYWKINKLSILILWSLNEAFPVIVGFGAWPSGIEFGKS